MLTMAELRSDTQMESHAPAEGMTVTLIFLQGWAGDICPGVARTVVVQGSDCEPETGTENRNAIAAYQLGSDAVAKGARRQKGGYLCWEAAEDSLR